MLPEIYSDYIGKVKKMKFLFTCGGTAGHINPALAVAGRLRELMPDCGILFIGADGNMETELVPREGYDIETVTVTNLSRGHDMEALRHNLHTVRNAAAAIRQSKKIIKDFSPDIVVGTGGYVCFPVIEAAEELGIPSVVHESNAVPGLTTKLLADRVQKIMVGFSDSVKHYRHTERVAVTGTPVRGQFDKYTKAQAKAELGLDVDKPLVVSVWGSLGAGFMNKLFAEIITGDALDGSFELIHAVGKRYYSDFCNKIGNTDLASQCADIREYIFDMPRVMAAADLILCRAGASTLAELCYMGKPAIIVPSPNVTNNHQERNARVLESAGGAKVILESELSAKLLADEIKALAFDRERLERMSEAMRTLAVRDSADRICGVILSTVK